MKIGEIRSPEKRLRGCGDKYKGIEDSSSILLTSSCQVVNWRNVEERFANARKSVTVHQAAVQAEAEAKAKADEEKKKAEEAAAAAEKEKEKM